MVILNTAICCENQCFQKSLIIYGLAKVKQNMECEASP